MSKNTLPTPARVGNRLRLLPPLPPVRRRPPGERERRGFIDAWIWFARFGVQWVEDETGKHIAPRVKADPTMLYAMAAIQALNGSDDFANDFATAAIARGAVIDLLDALNTSLVRAASPSSEHRRMIGWVRRFVPLRPDVRHDRASFYMLALAARLEGKHRLAEYYAETALALPA